MTARHDLKVASQSLSIAIEQLEILAHGDEPLTEIAFISINNTISRLKQDRALLAKVADVLPLQ